MIDIIAPLAGRSCLSQAQLKDDSRHSLDPAASMKPLNLIWRLPYQGMSRYVASVCGTGV